MASQMGHADWLTKQQTILTMSPALAPVHWPREKGGNLGTLTMLLSSGGGRNPFSTGSHQWLPPLLIFPQISLPKQFHCSSFFNQF